jgi:hypothetical protein
VEHFETVVSQFEQFEENSHAKYFFVLFYAVLKTEGDIFVELNQYDIAIKCYKTLKDACENWGFLKLKMKTYE